MRGSHGWQRWVFDSHRSAPSFARVRLESRLAGGSGIPSHLPAPGGKSETVCPKSLAALRRKGYVWSRRARGEGSGGEVKNALISRKGLSCSSKAISTKVKLSGHNLIYFTCLVSEGQTIAPFMSPSCALLPRSSALVLMLIHCSYTLY